jgi:phage-related holin
VCVLDFLKALESIRECWQYKALASALLTMLTFLFGDVTAAFAALWVLIVIDLLSKWASVTKQHIDKMLNCSGWVDGWCDTWEVGELNSHEMRYKFVPKVLVYMALIAAAHQLSSVIPSKVWYGVEWSQAPKDLVVIYLGLTEFLSINENFVGMGYTFLSPLANFCGRKRDQMVGSVVQTVTTPTPPEKGGPIP